MRKWELITDLFSRPNGAVFPECNDLDGRKFIVFYICECACRIYPQDWPKHFRLVEEPEFTVNDMIAAMLQANEFNNTQENCGIPIKDVKEIIETIRKRKAGR